MISCLKSNSFFLKFDFQYSAPLYKTLPWLGKPLKKTGYFMTTCQRVGRWQTQNMISIPKEIMIRGLVLESLVRKSEP